MKNIFTLLALLGCLPFLAQSQNRIANKQKHFAQDVSEYEDGTLRVPPPITSALPGNSNHKSAQAAYGTIVGTTAYDYHSNSSIDSKVSVDPNGIVTVVWTKGLPADPNGASRRIGYNSYDPGTATWSGEESVGNERRGWPSVPAYAGPEDMVFSHNAPLKAHIRNVAGSGCTR